MKVNDLKIALPPPAIMEVIHEPNEGKLRDVIKKGAENGFDLIFFVTSDNIALHGSLRSWTITFCRQDEGSRSGVSSGYAGDEDEQRHERGGQEPSSHSEQPPSQDQPEDGRSQLPCSLLVS